MLVKNSTPTRHLETRSVDGVERGVGGLLQRSTPRNEGCPKEGWESTGRGGARRSQCVGGEWWERKGNSAYILEEIHKWRGGESSDGCSR